MTTGVENGKVVSLNSGGSPDFGPLKAAFGPNGDKHSNNMTKNGILAYDEMCVDAPESANVAVVSADAGDDEDDVISLSSKASAESRSHSSESSDTEAPWPEYGPAPCTNYRGFVRKGARVRIINFRDTTRLQSKSNRCI